MPLYEVRIPEEVVVIEAEDEEEAHQKAQDIILRMVERGEVEIVLKDVEA
jgi:TATA-binding protein-associated factor Taf7